MNKKGLVAGCGDIPVPPFRTLHHLDVGEIVRPSGVSARAH